MPYADKDKQRKYQKEFLQNKKKNNPKWHIELKKRHKQKRDNIYDIVNHIKRTIGCLICEERNPEKLQFHHVVPELKLATVSQLISNRSKLIVILREIDKCVCVCTACHLILQNHADYVRKTIKNERWFTDWGLYEALDYSRLHPQNRLNKNSVMEIIKAVVRNTQINDPKGFKHIYWSR